MKDYRRQYPLFSLCGLNCGLCPRHHANSPSKCPGCGGEDFYRKHPSCAVISCAKKHDVAFCFECGDFPCPRYAAASEKDSFITYRSVLEDMKRAGETGIEAYMGALGEKIVFLEYLLAHYDDGRRKSFYCAAVALLPPDALEKTRAYITDEIESKPLSTGGEAARVADFIARTAAEAGIDLRLRK